MLAIHWRLVKTSLRPLTDLIADLLLPLNRGERLDLRIEAIEQRTGRHDVVIATGPGWSMFEFGAKLSSAWNSTFLPDYRDPWSVEIAEVGLLMMSNYGKGGISWLRKRRWRRLERRITKNAHGITAATPTVLENALRVIGERAAAVIFNGHEAPRDPTPSEANKKFTVVYTGSVYWEQEWEILDSALTRLEKEHPEDVLDLQVLMVGATSPHAPSMARVQHILDGHPSVTVLGRMDRLSTIQWQSRADRLLHVGFKSKRGILPLKFLEYIHAGVPVIQVSTGQDIQEAIIERTRTGVVVSDASTLAALLLDGISRWRSGGHLPFEPDKKALEEFSWDHQMERWRRFMLSVHRARITPE
jgi:glycosyltransferase involved in cell wall biosynthesis